MKIIGIHGAARSGKDTVGEIIYSRLLGLNQPLEITSFAKSIKQMLNVGLSIPNVWLHSNIKDEVIDGFDCTPRHMMQTLATEWGREMIHPDIWVMSLHESIKNTKKTYIIPDVRFQNEADYCRQHGILLHVVGRGGINSDHVSEKGLEVKEGDVVLDNSGSIEDLKKQIMELKL